MKSRDFCYWLQGFFELSHVNGDGITFEQASMIQKHLNMVFFHEIDPSMGGSQQQAELNEIHKPQIGGIDPTSGLLMRC
jgi:hypothetical protein